MSLTNCCNSCPEVQTVNTPGVQGDDGVGTNGTDGINAYSALTAGGTVPAAAGDSGTYAVGDSTWMVIGQIVVIGDPGDSLANPGPATFRVTAIPSATSFTGDWLDYPGDVAGGTALTLGCGVSPSGEMPDWASYRVAAAGTAAPLSTSSALLNFGTTDPALTLTNAGNYLVMARVRLDYIACTIDAQTVTLKLMENPATQLVATSFVIQAETTATRTLGIFVLPPYVYTAATGGKVLEIHAVLGTSDPGTGTTTFVAVEAEIEAVKIAAP